jgi:cytochrome c-type biogenesis protein CcmH
MLFWSILAAMTVGALAFVVWPFIARGRGVRAGNDLAVYRDQLEELERDRASGLIGPGDFEAARIEVSRRLIKASDSDRANAKSMESAVPRRWRTATLVAALVVVPLLSAGLYYRLGAPEAAGPAAVADKPGGPTVQEMIAQIEARLQRAPDDGRGWEVLAPVYMRMGRFDEAAKAWANVIRLQGETADREESLGEALVAAADGVVTADAKAAFDKALSLDRTTIAARYYMGLAAFQDGRRDEAGRIWRELLAAAPPDAPWAPGVRAALEQVEGKAAAPARPAEQGGAAQAPQADTIREMVARLAEKLQRNGDDPEGWLRLVRSYRVLREPDKASQAIADARKSLSGDSGKLRQFEDGLKALGQ